MAKIDSGVSSDGEIVFFYRISVAVIADDNTETCEIVNVIADDNY